MDITKEWLISHNASVEQIRIFQKAWPHGMRVEKEALEHARTLGVDLAWLSQELGVDLERHVKELRELVSRC